MHADDLIADRLRRAVPGLVAVYRFGSTARGDARPGSDVDLAFLASSPLDPLRRFEVQEDLAAELGRDVDLIDLKRASTVLRMQVVSQGDVVLDLDPATRGEFEDLVFLMFTRLNEERRGILERIAAEGQVFDG